MANGTLSYCPSSPQARLNSYAYLSQKEEEEPWTNLTLHLAESKPAESVWARFSTTNETQMSADMSRSAYLRSFVPSLADGEGDGEPSGDTALADVPRPSAATPALSSSQTLALAASMRSLFSKHAVCTLLNIRQWLQDPAQASLAKEVALSADRPLHDALMATGLLVCIRRTYLLIATENALTDPFRVVLLDLLKEKETFKRAEVLEAAQQRVRPAVVVSHCECLPLLVPPLKCPIMCCRISPYLTRSTTRLLRSAASHEGTSGCSRSGRKCSGEGRQSTDLMKTALYRGWWCCSILVLHQLNKNPGSLNKHKQ